MLCKSTAFMYLISVEIYIYLTGTFDGADSLCLHKSN